MKKLLLAASLLALIVPVTAFAADLASDPNYKTKCAMCHGANGEGKAAMKTVPMKDHAAKSETELTNAIEKGVPPKMAGFAGKLKPEEIKALVDEIKALK
jgi:cytochrome c6